MFRSLRGRLVLSHIIPLVIVVPLMYLVFSYLIESKFILPRLAQDLYNDARILTEIARNDYLTYGDQRSLQLYLFQLQPNPQVRLVFLRPDGRVLYSNDPEFMGRIGEKIESSDLELAKKGEDVLVTNYSIFPGDPYSISVMMPVETRNEQVVGILWMTYYESSLSNLFSQMRLIFVLVTVGSLLIGALLGSILAISIGRPVRKATDAIRGLARGERSDVLTETGPEEVRELVREVNVLVTRLHSLEQARRQLLANLVHELGRPLGALRSAIQALNRGAAKDPQLFNDLTTGMDEEAARLQDILNDLAHLHDQVLGPLELKLEPVEICDWLPRILIPWQEAALEKKLKWETDIPSDLPVVQIDRIRFAQVIGNLASNAIKYTPSGGKVVVRAGFTGEKVWLRFEDSGPGIPENEQKQLFQPFFQGLYGRRIKQGMGLGLSIAQDLARAHGGEITVESTLDVGSSFQVWLPAGNNENN